MRVFNFRKQRSTPLTQIRTALIETVESRRMLSATGIGGLDDGAMHDVNDNHGTVEVIHNQRGRDASRGNSGSGTTTTTTNSGRNGSGRGGADDGANHDVNDRRGGGADDPAGHH